MGSFAYRSHISGALYAGVVLRRMSSSARMIATEPSTTPAARLALPKSAKTQVLSRRSSTFSAFRSLRNFQQRLMTDSYVSYSSIVILST